MALSERCWVQFPAGREAERDIDRQTWRQREREILRKGEAFMEFLLCVKHCCNLTVYLKTY